MLKTAPKIAIIGKTGLIGDILEDHAGIFKQAAGIEQTNLPGKINKRIPRMFFE